MIIGDDKKKGAAAILALKMKPDHSGEMEEDKPEDQDDGKEGLRACAQEIMDAFIKRDVEMLMEGLHSFFELADQMPHKEGEHPDEDEDEQPAPGDMFPSIGVK